MNGPLSDRDTDEARRLFAYLRERRREVVGVETRLANLLGCHPTKVFNEVVLGDADDARAFVGLLGLTGHAPAEPERAARVFDVLELLRERQGFYGRRTR